MAFQDFREFLDALRKQGELFDVERPIALELELAKAMRKSAAVGGPAFVSGEACGAAVAEHGPEFFEVADVPGWREYDFPEPLNKPIQAR